MYRLVDSSSLGSGVSVASTLLQSTFGSYYSGALLIVIRVVLSYTNVKAMHVNIGRVI
jgi:hypothetical protein